VLQWKVKPHPWFRALVRWSLYNMILECDAPDYFNNPSLRGELNVADTTRGNIRDLCVQLLEGSQSTTCYQPSFRAFAVLNRVIYFALSNAHDVSDDTDVIEEFYFPVWLDPSEVITLGSQDYALVVVDPPPDNPRDATREPEECLYLERGEGVAVYPNRAGRLL